MPAAKIALFDIETSPLEGRAWSTYDTNIIKITKDWRLLSFAWKWLGAKTIQCHSLPDFDRFKKDPEDDSSLAAALWDVLDQADIVIAHNGDKFDIRKSNARFEKHSLGPPSPYKSIDTLKIARKHFQFSSNRLDYLGRFLSVGSKLRHGGQDLWDRVLDHDLKAWALMRRYNKQDVALLERVYLRLRPWASTHPLLTNYSRESACPTCQSSQIQFRGFNVNKTGRSRRIHCTSCGAWSSDSKNIQMDKSA